MKMNPMSAGAMALASLLLTCSATRSSAQIQAPPAPAPQTQPGTETLAKDPPLFLKLAAESRKWNEPAEPAKIVGPIHFVGTRGLGVFLITTSEGHILLNTGMPPELKLVTKSR